MPASARGFEQPCMNRYSLAELLRRLAVFLLLLGGVILLAAAVARLEGIVRERYQRLEQAAEHAE